MAEGMSFSFPSLLFHEGRTYGQPEVVPISLPQVATGLRSRLPGSFRRRGFQPDLLMPQEALFAREAHSMQAAMRRALLRRGRSGNAAFPKTESNVAGNLCRMCRKEESRHGDFSLHTFAHSLRHSSQFFGLFHPVASVSTRFHCRRFLAPIF